VIPAAMIFAPYASMSTADEMFMDGGIVVNKDTVDNGLHFTTTGLSTAGAGAGRITKYHPSAVELCTPGEGTSGC
jgi:hypothetical protein